LEKEMTRNKKIPFVGAFDVKTEEEILTECIRIVKRQRRNLYERLDRGNKKIAQENERRMGKRNGGSYKQHDGGRTCRLSLKDQV
jgi:hypothetical protein